MVSSAQSTASSVRQRPTSITAAVFLAIFIQVASIPFFFAPGAGDIPQAAIVIGIVLGVVTLVGCWGMWNLQRWGGILLLVVTFLNTVTSAPGLIDPPSGWILAELIAAIPLGILDMVLIALPVTWRAYRSA